MEIRGDIEIYAKLDYSEGEARNCKGIRSAQVCEKRIKTGLPVLQDHTWVAGTVP